MAAAAERRKLLDIETPHLRRDIAWPETAARARSSMLIASTSAPLRGDRCLTSRGIWDGLRRRRTNVDLPEPLGPIKACGLTGFHGGGRRRAGSGSRGPPPRALHADAGPLPNGHETVVFPLTYPAQMMVAVRRHTRAPGDLGDDPPKAATTSQYLCLGILRRTQWNTASHRRDRWRRKPAPTIRRFDLQVGHRVGRARRR